MIGDLIFLWIAGTGLDVKGADSTGEEVGGVGTIVGDAVGAVGAVDEGARVGAVGAVGALDAGADVGAVGAVVVEVGAVGDIEVTGGSVGLGIGLEAFPGVGGGVGAVGAYVIVGAPTGLELSVAQLPIMPTAAMAAHVFVSNGYLQWRCL